jgi:dihydrodipicolinate synthase/N-acetylneuraminate lyase
VLRGTLAAALTPLRDNGDALDEDAFEPYAAFLRELDGVLALGTTGEGILLSVDERRRAVDLFVASGLAVIAHCGAQTTAATVQLAEHAAGAGVHGIAVIAPPYFHLEDDALLAHFVAAARACEPTPFYVYEFERTSGYAVPVEVLLRLREAVPNLVGLKVSDAPWERFSPYLIEGLDVFVGPEALIGQGVTAGAVGAVSALAAAFPERVAAAVREPDGEEARAMASLRAAIERFPRHAALKRIVSRRGVAMREDVRAPLRTLSDEERLELDRWLESS